MMTIQPAPVADWITIASLLNAPNLILAAVALAFICYTLLLLNTNKEMRRFADWCNARADARDFMVQRYKEYRSKRDGN